MNPFANPKKRSVSLPVGCKDLTDVLRGPCCWDHQAAKIQRFIKLLLDVAQEQGFEEWELCPITTRGTNIRYRVGDTWHEFSDTPEECVPGAIFELGHLAGFLPGTFPKVGVLTLPFMDIRAKWRMRMSSRDANCILTPIHE